MEERLTLNKKEQIRSMVLNRLERKEMRLCGVASVLGVSERHVWRLLSAFRKEGAAGLAHGNRGRKPVNALPAGIRQRVVSLAEAKYVGFNHSHMTEKLHEQENTHLSRSTVRRILLEKGIRSTRKHRPSFHRIRRERCPREGMLLQIDGSPHDWLQGRGPRLCLIGAIDDATNRVPYALFQEHETTEGYMRMLEEIVSRDGIPAALYHDRHSIFRQNKGVLPTLDQQLRGEESRTQLGRLMDELGIESIAANSPQAKGRIERLWGTFQDRLTSELRLAKADTLEKANVVLISFLPDYNRRFAVAAREMETAYDKPGEEFRTEEYFCFKYRRTVGKDNVVRYEQNRIQVLPAAGKSNCAGCRVEIQVRLDGSLAVFYQGKSLVTQPAPLEATQMRKKRPIPVSSPSQPKQLVGACTAHKPASNHPWLGKFRTHLD